MLREAIEHADDGEVRRLSCEIARLDDLTLGLLDLATEQVSARDQ